jgi:transposase
MVSAIIMRLGAGKEKAPAEKLRSRAAVQLGKRAAVPQNGAGSTGSRKRPKQHRRTAMEYFAGLDVGVKTTAICVVDATRSVVLETSVATEPQAIRCAVEGYTDRLRRVGHEAVVLSPWLHRGLEREGVKMVLLETRHVHAALKAQRNKTDKNDALGVAQLVRSGSPIQPQAP